ncbi:hypothetical protein L208DRAFT_1380743 [Tricholoma matsutake]|nr:hypothetical protein L208DRAFT_1380743 [Tricholoma matsutake 945]
MTAIQTQHYPILEIESTQFMSLTHQLVNYGTPCQLRISHASKIIPCGKLVWTTILKFSRKALPLGIHHSTDPQTPLGRNSVQQQYTTPVHTHTPLYSNSLVYPNLNPATPASQFQLPPATFFHPTHYPVQPPLHSYGQFPLPTHNINTSVTPPSIVATDSPTASGASK